MHAKRLIIEVDTSDHRKQTDQLDSQRDCPKLAQVFFLPNDFVSLDNQK